MALVLLLAARIASAYYGHIADCDETYNYWEPLHYLGIFVIYFLYINFKFSFTYSKKYNFIQIINWNALPQWKCIK